MNPIEDPWVLRERLRSDLRSAMKTRDSVSVSTLRTLIAAIDNAEAAPVPTESPRSSGGVIANSSPGLGSTEVPRRELNLADIYAVVGTLLDEYDSEAAHYDSVQRPDAAEQLRRRAAVLRDYHISERD